MELKHHDVDYTVVQGIGGQIGKWAFVHDAKVLAGKAATKAEAVRDAERYR